MDDPKSFVIRGAAGHAKVLIDLIRILGGKVDAVFDLNPDVPWVLPGVPLYAGPHGLQRWLSSRAGGSLPLALVAIGGSKGAERLMVHNQFRELGFRIEPIVHPDATVSPTAVLGAGTQILARSVVSSGVSLGRQCIVNHGAVVDHECLVQEGCHLAPGATLCGCVGLGRNVMIGAGSTVLPRLTIGDNCIVGAGSVVTKDLPASVIAFGNPCRVVRNL